MEEILVNTATDAFLLEAAQLDKVEYTFDMEGRLEYLRRDKLTRPLIIISMGTASIVAGSESSLEMLKKYIAERKIDAEIVQTGCLGMSLSEPVIGIQLPGRTRLLFSNITEDRVVSLMDDVFHKTIPEKFLIAQIRNDKHEAYKDVPFLDETEFMKLQNRVILKNTGISDPGSLEEYIANGGFKSFVKTIKHYTSEEICDLVESSGLRGRSGSGFPTGKKWKTAFHTPSDQKYLICNAEESDPGAFMDRGIMEGDPFLLIEGMAIAAYGIAATKGIGARLGHRAARRHRGGAAAGAGPARLRGQRLRAPLPRGRARRAGPRRRELAGLRQSAARLSRAASLIKSGETHGRRSEHPHRHSG